MQYLRGHHAWDPGVQMPKDSVGKVSQDRLRGFPRASGKLHHVLKRELPPEFWSAQQLFPEPALSASLQVCVGKGRTAGVRELK